VGIFASVTAVADRPITLYLRSYSCLCAAFISVTYDSRDVPLGVLDFSIRLQQLLLFEPAHRPHLSATKLPFSPS